MRSETSTARLGVGGVDHAGKIVSASPGFWEILGTPWSSLEGEDLLARLPAGAREKLDALIARRIDAFQTESLERSATGELRAARFTFARNAGAEIMVVVESTTDRHRMAQRLAAQHAVAHILAEAETIQEASPRLLRAICESLDWDVGGLWIVDRSIGRLRSIEGWTAPGMEVPEFMALTRAMRPRPAEGLPGYAWSCGEPVWIENLPESGPVYVRGPVAKREGLHGAFAFPIVLGAEVLGVMDFFSREVRRPDEDVIQMLTTFGSQIGQFMERKRIILETKHAEENLRALAAELSAAEDRERRRLARDLHDSIGQSLSALKMDLARTEHTHGAVELVDQLIGQVRTLTFDLYPSMLDDLGLVPTLHSYVEQFARRAGVRGSLSEVGERRPLTMTATNYLFRATKELLNNVAKHAKATEVLVSVHWRAESMRLAVADDGAGFDPALVLEPNLRRGLGLVDIRERVRAMGGLLLVDSAPGRGSQVVLELPRRVE